MKKFKLSDDFLNKFEIFLLVLIVSIISFYVVLSKLILKYNTIISIIIGIISLISAILTIIIENTKDKRKKLKQEKTINDYKPNLCASNNADSFRVFISIIYNNKFFKNV